jgi:hypothetical protein
MVRQGGLDSDRASGALSALVDLVSRDDVHVIETPGDIIEFECALENWLRYRASQNPQYRASQNPHYVARLSENLMNMLDFCRVDAGFPSGHWLSVKEIKEEFTRQLHCYGGSHPAEFWVRGSAA